jgi:hypothetical protein
MEKLIQLIEKIEAQINQVLSSLLAAPFKVVSKDKLLSPFVKIKNWIVAIVVNTLTYLQESAVATYQSFKKFFKNINYYFKLWMQSLSILKNHGLKKGFEFFSTELGALFSRIVKKVENLGPKKFFFLCLFIMFAVLNGFHLVSTSKKFVTSLPFMQKKVPESPTSKLPDYYNFREKKVRMNEVRFPLFVNGPRRMKHLNLDLTIEFTNRTSQMYFLQNRVIFQDHLQLTLSPMDPQFSLTDEGKNIQREKIKHEIDNVLKTREIAGEVKAVHIEYLLVN